MRASDFDYDLPPELIAQHPAPHRDASRLLVLDRASRALAFRRFSELPELLRPGDLLVLNNSRVIPARLRARKPGSGGQVELLLLEQNARNDWWAMMKPAKRVRPGSTLELTNRAGAGTGLMAEVLAVNEEGHRRLQFLLQEDLLDRLDQLGEVPLPPYIARPSEQPQDRDRYQTVYAGPPGSVAAPTAGLHFTAALLEQLRGSGISAATVTLHVGPGTFAPVKADRVQEHRLHEEVYEISEASARAIEEARRRGGRIVAVGTTSVRVLETAGGEEGALRAGRGKTRLFIHPPCRFRWVDALITNFHLPRSTLLMLVSAFASPGRLEGRELVLGAYREAVARRFRFFSYGDAMLVV